MIDTGGHHDRGGACAEATGRAGHLLCATHALLSGPAVERLSAAPVDGSGGHQHHFRSRRNGSSTNSRCCPSPACWRRPSATPTATSLVSSLFECMQEQDGTTWQPRQLFQAAHPQRHRQGRGPRLRAGPARPAVIYGHHREPESLHVDAGGADPAAPGHAAPPHPGRRHGRRPCPGEGAHPRNPAESAPSGQTIVHIDLYEVARTKRSPWKWRSSWSAVPDGVRNSGGVLEQQIHALQIRVLPATSRISSRSTSPASPSASRCT